VNIERELFTPLVSSLALAARKVVRSLPEDEQLVLQLFYVEGLNLPEVAKVLRVSVDEVAETHEKAITNFRKTLLHEVYRAEIDDC
jgi:RNA polymerase sigma factor (sigma-70 family)